MSSTCRILSFFSLLLPCALSLQAQQWTPQIHTTGNCDNGGYTTTITVKACDTYGWDGGTVYFDDDDNIKMDDGLGSIVDYVEDGTVNQKNVYTSQYECDSIIVLHLDLRKSSKIPSSPAVCDSFVWVNDTVLRTSGTYVRIIGQNKAGCDSTEVLSLNIKGTTTYRPVNLTYCDTFKWAFNGNKIYTESTLDTVITTGTGGCPQITSLNLTINKKTRSVLDTAVCDGFSWVDAYLGVSKYYTESVQDSVVGTKKNVKHCDSTRVLNLTVNYSDTIKTDTTACDAFTWYADHLTYDPSQNTTYSKKVNAYLATKMVSLGKNRYKCDSVATLDLTLHLSSSETVYEEDQEDNLPHRVFDFELWHDTSNATIHGVNQYNCDSNITYSFHVIPNVYDTIDTTVCSNQLPVKWHKEEITLDYPTKTIDTSDYVFTHSRSSYPDTHYAVILRVNPAYDSVTDTAFCQPQTIYFNHATHSDAMTDSLIVEINKTVLHNCDSTITLRLTIYDTTHANITERIVVPQLPYTTTKYPDTLTFTAEQMQGGDDTLIVMHTTNMHQCDSTIYFNLHVTDNPTATLDSAVCENFFPFTWNHRTFTDGGTQLDTLPSMIVVDGVHADSIITMNVVKKTNHTQDYDTTVFENDLGYTFHDITVNGAMTAKKITLANAGNNGCDSIINYTVRVIPNVTERHDTMICGNEFPFTWRDSVFTTRGTKKTRLRAASGADSLLILNLMIFPSSDETIDTAVCRGAVITFGSHTFDTTVYYVDSLTNGYGCDSVMRLNLFVDTARYDTIRQAIVENQLPYTFLNRQFTIADFIGCDSIVEDIIGQRVAVPHCDSNVHYTLRVYKNVSTSADSTICYNFLPLSWDSYTFVKDSLHGAMAGTLVFADSTLKTEHGADSILLKRLHVNATYLVYDTINHCLDAQDQPIPWRHTTLPAGTPTGNYTLDTVSQYGCDSLFRLRLELRTNTSSVVHENKVENDLPYTYNVQYDYAFNGPVTDTLLHIDNIYGCDSAVTYSLNIYWNVYADAYDTICFSSLPFVWNKKTFYASSLTDEPHRTGDINTQAILTAHTGADSILTMHLHVNPTFDTLFFDTICADSTYQFNGNSFSFRPNDNKDFRHNDTLQTYLHCDSVSSIMLRVWPTYDTVQYDTVFSYALPKLFGPFECDTIGTYHYGTRSTHGCDSLNTLHLWITQVTFFDTAVCNNHVPFEWHQRKFSYTKLDTLKLIGMHGEDSLLVMDVTVLDTSAVYDRQEACDLFTWQDNITYAHSIHTPTLTFTNMAGCDSVLHLDLTLYNSIEIADHISVCNTHTWINGVTYDSTIYGPKKLLKTIHGCDSLVTLELFVSYSTYDEFIDSMCLGGRYDFRGRIITRSGTYFDSLYTANGCDSVTVLHLAELPTPLIEFDIQRDCDEHIYTITSTTDVDYFRWSASPADPSFTGQESNSVIYVKPTEEITYTLYTDYIESNRCPSHASVTLAPLNRPTAALRTSPTYLTYNNMTVNAFDIGEVYDYRNWYINGFMQDEHETEFHYDADLSLDSVIVMLEVDNGLCRDSVTAVIKLHKPTLFLPNTFTPYLSSNNLFKAQGTGILEFEMYIYSRKGQLIFKTRDMNEGWDGKHNDTFCPQGAYIYTIRYRDIATPDSYQTMTGAVTLLR